MKIEKKIQVWKRRDEISVKNQRKVRKCNKTQNIEEDEEEDEEKEEATATTPTCTNTETQT